MTHHRLPAAVPHFGVLDHRAKFHLPEPRQAAAAAAGARNPDADDRDEAHHIPPTVERDFAARGLHRMFRHDHAHRQTDTHLPQPVAASVEPALRMADAPDFDASAAASAIPRPTLGSPAVRPVFDVSPPATSVVRSAHAAASATGVRPPHPTMVAMRTHSVLGALTGHKGHHPRHHHHSMRTGGHTHAAAASVPLPRSVSDAPTLPVHPSSVPSTMSEPPPPPPPPPPVDTSAPIESASEASRQEDAPPTGDAQTPGFLPFAQGATDGVTRQLVRGVLAGRPADAIVRDAVYSGATLGATAWVTSAVVRAAFGTAAAPAMAVWQGVNALSELYRGNMGAAAARIGTAAAYAFIPGGAAVSLLLTAGIAAVTEVAAHKPPAPRDRALEAPPAPVPPSPLVRRFLSPLEAPAHHALPPTDRPPPALLDALRAASREWDFAEVALFGPSEMDVPPHALDLTQEAALLPRESHALCAAVDLFCQRFPEDADIQRLARQLVRVVFHYLSPGDPTLSEATRTAITSHARLVAGPGAPIRMSTLVLAIWTAQARLYTDTAPDAQHRTEELLRIGTTWAFLQTLAEQLAPNPPEAGRLSTHDLFDVLMLRYAFRRPVVGTLLATNAAVAEADVQRVVQASEEVFRVGVREFFAECPAWQVRCWDRLAAAEQDAIDPESEAWGEHCALAAMNELQRTRLRL